MSPQYSYAIPVHTTSTDSVPSQTPRTFQPNQKSEWFQTRQVPLRTQEATLTSPIRLHAPWFLKIVYNDQGPALSWRYESTELGKQGAQSSGNSEPRATIGRQTTQTSPGRAMHVGLKGETVVLTPGEKKKKLMRLHWRYWAGKRYEDVEGGEGDGGTGYDGKEDKKMKGKGDGRGEDKELRRETEGGNEKKEGKGDGQGEGEEQKDGDEARERCRKAVHEALANPDVPEEEEPNELPLLHIVSPSIGHCSPELKEEGTPTNWTEWAEKYGHRVV